MANSFPYYDSAWDRELQREYKAGERGLGTNRVKNNIQPPRVSDFLSMPRGIRQKKFRDVGADLLKKGKLGVLHLNGGLATRFGQIKATHEVGEFFGRPRTFLELKIGHVRWAAKTYGGVISYGLMNSPLTEPVTREFLAKHDAFGLGKEQIITFVQSVLRRKVPYAQDLREYFSKNDRTHSAKINLEYFRGREGDFLEPPQWAPAGHFDAAAMLILSKAISKFLDAGVEYLQISNIDNLAATLEPSILGILAAGPEDLLVEVATKRPEDRGGIPVRWNNEAMVLLEEIALPEGFQAERVQQFNTATYWIKISRLLDIFGLTPVQILEGPQDVLLEHVRKIRREIPVYTVLRKGDALGAAEGMAAQDEQLLGDITRLYAKTVERSPSYLLIDRDKRFVPVKTKEDLVREQPRIQAVLRGQLLLS